MKIHFALPSCQVLKFDFLPTMMQMEISLSVSLLCNLIGNYFRRFVVWLSSLEGKYFFLAIFFIQGGISLIFFVQRHIDPSFVNNISCKICSLQM